MENLKKQVREEDDDDNIPKESIYSDLFEDLKNTFKEYFTPKGKYSSHLKK